MSPDSKQQDQIASVGAPEYLIIGQIVAPFGVRGEVKVNILTEFPERFQDLQSVVLAPFSSIAPGLAPTAALDPSTIRRASAGPEVPAASQDRRTYQIENVRSHGGQLLLKFSGVDSTNSAEALRGYWLLVPRDQARKLPRGAHYVYEIVGLDVYTTQGHSIGKIEDVLTTAANDIYVVRGPGVADSGGELLVPAIKTVVRRIELKRGRIVIEPPETWS